MIMNEKIISRLANICGEKNVIYRAEDVDSYLYDETEELIRPEACKDCVVVRPGTYEEVSDILKAANEMMFPVIPRGGATGACGAIIPTQPSVIMVMEKFSNIIEIDRTNMMVTTQAGMTLKQLNDFLSEIGRAHV